MRITADTNVLARLVVRDDPAQSVAATAAIDRADGVVLTTIALVEFAWVLRRNYGLARADVIRAIEQLTTSENAICDRRAVQAGLKHLRLGGDFADGLIVHEGATRGADTFVSFDRRAVALTQAAGVAAAQL